MQLHEHLYEQLSSREKELWAFQNPKLIDTTSYHKPTGLNDLIAMVDIPEVLVTNLYDRLSKAKDEFEIGWHASILRKVYCFIPESRYTSVNAGRCTSMLLSDRKSCAGRSWS